MTGDTLHRFPMGRYRFTARSPQRWLASDDSDSTFPGNSGPNGSGGAIYYQSVSLAITNSTVISNTASDYIDLERCGTNIVAIGALLILGSAASRFAAERAIPLEHIAALPNVLWLPTECPLCAARIPLDDALGLR